ncbi:MAG: hypothetical protein GY711_09340 [bacterium]|nr:hypothetical protein [bacterium]
MTVFSGGGCPDLPDLDQFDFGSIGGALATLAKVPKILKDATNCIKPKENTTNDKGADISPCNTQVSTAPVEGDPVEATGTSHGFYTYQNASNGNGYYANHFNPFESEFDAAEDGDPQTIGGLIGQIALAQQGCDGAAFAAQVRVQHFDSPPLPPTSDVTVTLRGDVTTDGRFKALRVTPDDNDANGGGIVHTTTYDGRYLSNVQELAEGGNIHLLDGSNPIWVEWAYLLEIGEVYDWLADPFDLSLFSLANFEDSVDPNSGLQVVENIFTDGTGYEFVGERYEVTIRDGIALPLKRWVYDTAGFEWFQEEYSNFFQFRPGDWRPGTIKETRYLTSDLLGPKVVTTTSINQAAALDATAAAAVPASGWMPNQLWTLWTSY